MKTSKTIHAMQDKNFRAQLSPRERHELGADLSGIVELDDQLLEAIGGGSNNGCGSDGAKVNAGSCIANCQV